MLTLAVAVLSTAVQASPSSGAPRAPKYSQVQILPAAPYDFARTHFDEDLDASPPHSLYGPTGNAQGWSPTGGPVGPNTLYSEIVMNVPGVGSERFLYQGRTSAVPRPLLVLFHRSGVSHYDALLSTTYFQEAWRRGWYVVAPFGGNQTHYSSLPSQARLEAIFDWVDANCSVDRTRIYAVGFSMGGGAAMNFGARHLSPDDYMFAAAVNISGLVSHEHTYLMDPSAQSRFDTLFGPGLGLPAEPWKMQRSSLFSFDPFTFQSVVDSDLARNLLHISTQSFHATGDIPYLITENALLQQHLLALGADPLKHTLTIVNTPPVYHKWDIADEVAVCNWLTTKSLAWPTSGNTLADRDGRYFYFEVSQESGGAFTPFTWDVQSIPNTLSITGTSNLTKLKVHTLDAGLDRDRALQVTLSAADGVPDELWLLDWPVLPLDVLKDGLPTLDWTHNSATSELTLQESDGNLHVWTIVP